MPAEDVKIHCCGVEEKGHCFAVARACEKLAETITEMVLPGVYIEVRPEGLIVPSPISVGNVGVVGTAEKGENGEVKVFSKAAEAKEIFGETGDDTAYTLLRAIDLIFKHGGRTVYAVKIEEDGLEDGLKALENQDVHIIVAAGLGVNRGNISVASALQLHCEKMSSPEEMRERIAVVGCEETEVDDITDPDEGVMAGISSNRVVVVAPGIEMEDGNYSGAYAAAVVAGNIASLAYHVSPTNKTLSITGLAKEYKYSELKQLVQNRVCALEKKKRGFRIVRGITSSTDTAWTQITTRRIVDYAKMGVRNGGLAYIGKINNARVRGALKATLEGFLATMIRDEALVDYSLSVSATRADEKEGRCLVDMTLQPTFSIDYIRVTMYLG